MSAPELFLGGRVALHCGDSREVLRALPDASIHAVVTDPPYALVSIRKRFGAADAAPAQHGRDGLYARASVGFMGKDWDTGETAFAVDFWAEVLRVLKPGGHVVAFGGTRTDHRLKCAIEDAGFEVRDTLLELMNLDPVIRDFVNSLTDAQLSAFLRVMDLLGFEGLLAWVYGSGFPKSHDVAKGIAKRRIEDVQPMRVVCRFLREAMDAKGLKSRDLAPFFGDCNPRLVDHWAARDTDSQPSLPTAGQWHTLVDVLGLAERDGFEFVAKEWARLNERKGEHSDEWSGAEVIGAFEGAPAGFGDHRFTVRDNLERALKGDAADWQGWGTAMKPAWEPIILARKPLDGTVAANVLAHGTGALNIDGCRIGDEVRHAAYTSLAPCHGNALGAAGTAEARRGTQSEVKTYVGRWPANVLHDGSPEVAVAFPDDAARFFYSAKADAEDRLGSKHPTVKPVALMQWLCRLVTPPGGTVLDPFAGTGTTGEAAWREGFSAVLIEREAEYQADIRRRMALCLEGPATRKRAAAKARGAQTAPLPLFGADEAKEAAE